MKRKEFDNVVSWNELLRLLVECVDAQPTATRDLLRAHRAGIFATKRVVKQSNAAARIVKRRRVSKK